MARRGQFFWGHAAQAATLWPRGGGFGGSPAVFCFGHVRPCSSRRPLSSSGQRSCAVRISGLRCGWLPRPGRHTLGEATGPFSIGVAGPRSKLVAEKDKHRTSLKAGQQRGTPCAAVAAACSLTWLPFYAVSGGTPPVALSRGQPSVFPSTGGAVLCGARWRGDRGPRFASLGWPWQMVRKSECATV